MNDMKKRVIMYGAGSYARENVCKLIAKGFTPVCFADRDASKHYHRLYAACSTMNWEILPLKEAVIKYPDSNILITVGPYAYPKVYDYIINSGIGQERVCTRFYDQDSPRAMHCKILGKQMNIDRQGIYTCCTPQTVFLPSSGNFNDDLTIFKWYSANLANDLSNGKLTSCHGCFALEEGAMVQKPQIELLNLSTGLPGGDVCSFKCSYCTYGEDLSGPDREDTVVDILRIASEMPHIPYIHYACGEITVSQYKDEIINLWADRKLKGKVFTNAYIYNSGLFELMSNKLAELFVSLDAGTEETFMAVKGINGFNQVINNLKMYVKSNGHIDLKYILLDGINTGKTDTDGFITIAKDINSRVIISGDHRKNGYPLSDDEYAALLRLIQQCGIFGLSYVIDISIICSSVTVERLKSDGVY